MNILSTEMLDWGGSMCQAAIVTFQPFTMGLQLFFYSLLSLALLKIFASIAKAYLTFRSLAEVTTTSKKVQTIATKHGLPARYLTVINDPQLIAFSSVMPWISNGIFISQGACQKLTLKQLEAVVLHEIHHWQKRDPLIQLCLSILGEVFFFIPSIQDLRHHWQLQAELSADAMVVRRLGNAISLKSALAKWLSTAPYSSAPFWAIAFAETELDTRIQNLGQPQSMSSRLHFNSKVLGRLLISLATITALATVQTSRFAQAEAKLILPTSPQCTQAWQQNAAQSSVFTVMSHQ